MATYKTYVTDVGAAKIINAQLNGTKVKIASFVAGDGGGNEVNPSPAQTALVNEVYSGPIASATIDDENSLIVVYESAVPSSVGNFYIREVGLKDEEGDLIAVGNYPESYKPIATSGSTTDLIVKMKIQVSNTDAINFKIDPTAAIASRDYVDKNVASAEGRLTQQLAQTINKDEFYTKKSPLQLTPLPTFANGINNCAPFNQDNLTVYNGWQYAVWVDNDFKVVAGKRRLPNGKWLLANLSDMGILNRASVKKDGHNNFSIGVDKLGYIHIAGDMHAETQNYVRSATPQNFDFVDTYMLTPTDGGLSYPRFVKRKDGELLFIYRKDEDVSHFGADTHINIYDTTTKTWSKLVPKLIDGVATNEHPYLNHVAVGKDGSIQITGTFRSQSLGGNNDIFYMKSPDGGITWTKSNGEVYTLPVTHTTLEIAKFVSVTKGLLNQNGFEIDEEGNPHVTYYMKESVSSPTNIYHLYHNGTSWVDEVVTNLSKPLSGNLSNHTAELSRPSIFTYKNRVFIIYRVNYDGKKGTLRMIEVTPGSRESTSAAYKDFPILELDLGIWEPSFDTQALYQRGELHMLIVPSTKDISEVNTNLSQLDNWDKQFGAVLSIDLEQIDKLIRREVQLPHLRITHTTTGEKQSMSESGTVALNNGNIIINNGKNMLFAKLSVRGRGDINTTKMTVRLKTTDFDPVTFSTLNSLVFSAGTENKVTPFRPLPINGEMVVIEAEALVDGFGTPVSANVDAVTIQIAELVY